MEYDSDTRVCSMFEWIDAEAFADYLSICLVINTVSQLPCRDIFNQIARFMIGNYCGAYFSDCQTCQYYVHRIDYNEQGMLALAKRHVQAQYCIIFSV